VDPQRTFCPNPECPAIGQMGQGSIEVHRRKEGRYICRVCKQTFAARTGTMFYRLRTTAEMVTRVVTLLAYGCPLQASIVAFDLDERTVQDWQARAGQHCERVHEHLVQQPRDLGQVQADEIRVKNFCTDHDSLRVAGIIGGHKWLPRTPAMAAGIADHRWTVYEVLAYRVPLPGWSPPRRRGRRSAALKALIARWRR
jgi:transposase-like protein